LKNGAKKMAKFWNVIEAAAEAVFGILDFFN
jgi:hypothetical protein